MTHHSQCEEGVKFDEAMEVTEQNRCREEDQICWISNKEGMQLDIFGNQHPSKLGNQGVELIVV